ncbi:phage tail sheath family protein [Fusobacteria bacterium ZRK30]|nr:phage tail sheath family protein [Fusobacteria bacterium ZRK30]
MGTINHGVKTSETSTSMASVIESGNCAVIIGTAPVNLAKSPKINTPVLCYSEKEAIEAFGYSDDWANYTLCEAIDVFFRLFKVGPVVFINVLDPATHKEAVADTAITFTKKKGTITDKGILLPSLALKQSDDTVVPKDKYTAVFNEDGSVSIIITDTALAGTLNTGKVSYDKLKPSLVTETDIIGGIDTTTLVTKGISLINQIFPKYNKVPNIGLAPGWTDKSKVMTSLVSAMKSINEVFTGIALADIDSTTIDKYNKVTAWKNDNSYIHENLYNFWPMGLIDKTLYHISTLAAASMYAVDTKNGDIPYESPSNKPLNITGICLKNKTEVDLLLTQADYLNDNGIATSINFNAGWRLWGNRTGCYPANRDIKDNTISCKRMFIWDNNNFTLTYWLDVDKPANNKLMDKIVDSYNDYYNGLVTTGAILGGRIEFNKQDNPTTKLMDGKYNFKRYMTPVGVAEKIESALEYDTEYLKKLFGGGK